MEHGKGSCSLIKDKIHHFTIDNLMELVLKDVCVILNCKAIRRPLQSILKPV